MKRIIAVEPGEWVILPCILETDDFYYRVDVYPDGRVEAGDDERFAKADLGGPDYKRSAAIYNSQNDYMMFLRRPIPLTPKGNMPVAGGSQLATMAREVHVAGGLRPHPRHGAWQPVGFSPRSGVNCASNTRSSAFVSNAHSNVRPISR